MHSTLGHYRIVEQIGAGGMGVVYRARDEHLERDVALKVLSGDALPDETSRRRFRREALALSKLNHPNIATVHAFDTFDDVDVLVMEHIPGHDLDELLKNGPLAEPEILRLGRQLVTALDVAHQHGVIHRDLKPGNVRVTEDGRLKVLDFGLAQALTADADATTRSLSNTAFAGTLPYMAPEQVRGGRVDHRTDIYGAGAVLYEMATGSRLHPGKSGAQLLGAVLEDAPVPARSLNPRISPALDALLMKALDKDPARRYQSPRELQVDLERLEPGRSASVSPRRPWRAVHWVALLLVLSVGTLAAWTWWPRSTPFTGRLLIADFENHAGDASLTQAISLALTMKLQQSRALNVLSREQVVEALRRMKRSQSVPTLDTETARELCQREGISLLIAGSVHRQGDSILISVRGLEPGTGTPRFIESAEFRSDGEIFRQMDTLAGAVRRRLGEPLSGIAESNTPLAEVTTGSVDALKLYTRARERHVHGDYDAALLLLNQALALDREFASAHRLIARVYETRGASVQAREHQGRAYEYRTNLTQKERLHVESSYFKGMGEYEKAVETLTALTNLYPSDSEARYELALAYRDAGQSRQAIEQLEATLAADKYFGVGYGTLALQLVRVGDFSRARSIYEQARRIDIHTPQLEWAYGIVLLGERQLDEARRVFTALEASSQVHAGIARLYLASADILEGHLDAAGDRLRSDIIDDRRRNDLNAEVKRRFVLGRILLLKSQKAEAATQSQSILEDGRGKLGANEVYLAGTLAAAVGRTEVATQLLRDLDQRRRGASSAFAESCYQNLAAEIALAAARSADAAEGFRNALSHYPRAVSREGLARAYSAQAAWPRARQAWQEVVDAGGELLHEGAAIEWVLAHLELARASRALNDAEAPKHYDRFLEFWRNGDKLQILRAVMDERRTLGRQ